VRHVESPVLGDGYAGFGRRPGETDRSEDRNRAPGRPYKAEAVDLVPGSGRPVAEIARDLGIHEATLGNWVNLAKKNGTIADKPVTVDERARLRELEDEVRKLRMERDFLKKAAAWFASQNQ
jgi:transposase